MKTFEEQEAKGVKFSEDHKTLLRVPMDFSGEYEIPNGVTKIGNEAFSWCKNLTSINIPDSVTNIGEYAFSGCTNLTSANISNRETEIEYGAFSDTPVEDQFKDRYSK